MTTPVPGSTVGTPYGRRGSYWSCHRDAAGNGIHTGVDYPAPVGTSVVAARPGTAVYCDHGSAFGAHQLEILPGDGTRDFYAHMTTRTVGDGQRVEAGQLVGKVGAEGNVTGPHLHFERHSTAAGGWSCDIIRDPQPSIDYQPEVPEMPLDDDDLARIRTIVKEENQRARPDYVTSFLAGEVDGLDPPTTVKKSLRLSADAAREGDTRAVPMPAMLSATPAPTGDVTGLVALVLVAVIAIVAAAVAVISATT